jgi:hypothetical protein
MSDDLIEELGRTLVAQQEDRRNLEGRIHRALHGVQVAAASKGAEEGAKTLIHRASALTHAILFHRIPGSQSTISGKDTISASLMMSMATKGITPL